MLECRLPQFCLLKRMFLLQQFWRSKYDWWFFNNMTLLRNMCWTKLCLTRFFRSETKQGQYMFDIPTIANSIGVTTTVLSNHLQILKVCILLSKLESKENLLFEWKMGKQKAKLDHDKLTTTFIFFNLFTSIFDWICANLIHPKYCIK